VIAAGLAWEKDKGEAMGDPWRIAEGSPRSGVPEPEDVRRAWQPCNPIPRKRDVGQ